MVWDSSWTESTSFCVTGSSSVLNIGSKISLYRSITASSSRVAWVDMLNSSMTEFALARVSMPCSHQRAKYHLAGSKVYDWLNGHYKFGNKVTFHPVFHTRYIFQHHQCILVTFINSRWPQYLLGIVKFQVYGELIASSVVLGIIIWKLL